MASFNNKHKIILHIYLKHKTTLLFAGTTNTLLNTTYLHFMALRVLQDLVDLRAIKKQPNHHDAIAIFGKKFFAMPMKHL